ncbi:MAG: putative ABC transport system permease protein [Myxococcota bacterium]|jgi:putative ABC transport system permease protein
MRTLLYIAFRNLVQSRTRTALLSAAIGLVTLMLVLLLSVSAGIEDNMVGAATTLSGGHINVAGFYKATADDSSPLVTDAAKLRKILEEKTPGLDYIIDRQRGWAKVISDSGSTQAGLVGIDPDQEERLMATLQLAPESEYLEGGREEIIGSMEDLREPNTAAIFVGQAERLEVKVGDGLTIQTETQGGQTNTADVRVVAVARDMGMISGWSLFMRKDDVIELYRLNQDTTGAFWVYLDDIDDATATMGTLRTILADEGYALMDHMPAPFFFKFDGVAGEDWTGQKLDLTIWRDEVSFLTWVLTAFNTVTWFLVLVLVSIIAVGIMNALWNSVRERTKEIGTMRAIGLTRRGVLVLILLEALLLGLFATTAGAVGGAVIALIVDFAAIPVPYEAMQTILLAETLHLKVNPLQAISAIVLLTAFTGLSAIWPAWRAATMPPVTAIHQVE